MELLQKSRVSHMRTHNTATSVYFWRFKPNYYSEVEHTCTLRITLVYVPETNVSDSNICDVCEFIIMSFGRHTATSGYFVRSAYDMMRNK